MIIKKKKIRSYSSYFSFLKAGENLRLIIRVGDVRKSTVEKMGFSGDLSAGMSILPAPAFGTTSLFNSEGKEIKRKDLPMETAYTTIEWHWQEWHGQDTVERTEFRDRPYQRYQREFIAPPSEELEVMLMGDELVFASRILTNSADKERDNLHVANLFLEIFGQAEVVSRDLQNFHSPEQRKLNWQILPPGEYPWEKVNERLEKIVATLPEGNRHWAQNRIETVRKHKPDFHAVGAGGFYGYVVYGFSRLGLYVLETIRYGNATYIFKSEWETLSQLTKAQVLESGASVRRIIHHSGWNEELDEILKES